METIGEILPVRVAQKTEHRQETGTRLRKQLLRRDIIRARRGKRRIAGQSLAIDLLSSDGIGPAALAADKISGTNQRANRSARSSHSTK